MEKTMSFAVLEAKHTAEKKRKEALWDDVALRRDALEAQKEKIAELKRTLGNEEEKLDEMAEAYAGVQVEHNKALVSVQEAGEAMEMQRLKEQQKEGKPQQRPKSKLENVTDDMLAVWDEVTSKLDPSLDLSTSDPARLLDILRSQGRSDVECTSFLNCWEAAYAPYAPRRSLVPVLRLPDEPYVILPRTVYGEGVNFLKLVDRSKWTVVETPQKASLIWERDALEEFRNNDFNPKTQALNRMTASIERLFADKAELVRNTPPGVMVPETHLLTGPMEFLNVAQKVVPNLQGKWILKRSDLASGFGLTVIENMQKWWAINAPKIFLGMKDKRHRYVLQRYIDDPLLVKLSGDTVGRKFDMRCYFLIASTNPLVVYYRSGTVRMNIEEYKNSDFENPHIHISNIAQQRTHKRYQELQDKLKMHIADLTGCLGEARYKKLEKNMKQALHDIVVSKRQDVLKDAGRSRFQLLAADFICDASLNCYLLETQTGPALSHDDRISRQHIPQLVNETLEVAYEALHRTANGESLATLHSLEHFLPLINESIR